MQTVHDQWVSYLEQVMPSNAGPIQIQETRRAFYAGAFALCSLLQESRGLQQDLDKYTAECMVFAQNVVDERGL